MAKKFKTNFFNFFNNIMNHIKPYGFTSQDTINNFLAFMHFCFVAFLSAPFKLIEEK